MRSKIRTILKPGALSRLRHASYKLTPQCLQPPLHRFLPPPPPPLPTAPPPSPPPPFVHNDTTVNFNGCQTTCVADEFLCRDGGPGSFSPALCDYGTACLQCGPRQRVDSVRSIFDGDDSCQYANDGFCQDGRPSTSTTTSVFVTLAPDQITHVCGYLTDSTDCGPGTIDSVSEASFNNNEQHPFPTPPPPAPTLPTTAPERFTSGCNNDAPCIFQLFCSDGGINSHPFGHDPSTGAAAFTCDIGTQCRYFLCEPRIVTETVLCTDACVANSVSGGILWTGRSRNGICEDGGTVNSFYDRLEYGNLTIEGQQGNQELVNYTRVGGCGFGNYKSNSNSACSSLRTRPYSPLSYLPIFSPVPQALTALTVDHVSSGPIQ